MTTRDYPDNIYYILRIGELSVDARFLLLYLIEDRHRMRNHCIKTGDLEKDEHMKAGWYHHPIDDTTEWLGKPYAWQLRHLKELEEAGYIDTQLRGIPAGRYVNVRCRILYNGANSDE